MLHEFPHHAMFPQHLCHDQHQVGGGCSLGQVPVSKPTTSGISM
ncbi:MAG: hypothetical protein R3C12_22280 [Planctomycetaceae bacterium]